MTLSVLASSESKFAFDKSFPRDNTFCHVKERRIELLIRGSNKYTEPKERGYGEYIFLRNLPSKVSKLLTLNKSRGDTFKLFLGTSPQCSKSHGYLLDSNTLAVLLQKENRPYSDKLVIQFFDVATMSPREALETNYATDRAAKTDNGFAFRVMAETHNLDMGRVSIEGQKYIFQEKIFPVWVNYSKKGFEVLSNLTFDKFPWKEFFKDQEDFNSITGWNNSDKVYSNKIVYVAVNHKLRKKCILFIKAKQKLSGSESWRCQAR